MSKLVCHMGKYSRSNVFGIQKHNQRENKKYSNENVDLEKTHLNYDLSNAEKIRYLNQVDEIIKNNRTNTDRAVRKDAVVFVDTVVGSDKEFFNNLSPQETRKFFEESYKYLESKVGNENVVSATVHMDENNPHMHFSFVPINEDGSLSAKKKINRSFLREIQDEFPKVLKNKGFDIERGMEKSLKKHLEPLEFKKEQIKKDQIEIDKKVLENQKKFETVENVAKGLFKIEEQTKGLLDKLEKVQVKRMPLSRNYSISAEDYSILISLAKIGESKIVKNIQLESRIAKLEKNLEKNGLDEEITKAKLKRLNDVEGKYLELQKRHNNLKNVFQSFEGALKELRILDKVIDRME
ncbi:plasmid recombination protein, partial [Clostridium botulinum]|nr:plasmid recombination protein [Clostridium botulinum]